MNLHVILVESYEAAAVKLKDYVEHLRNTTELDASDEELGRGARK